MKNSYLRTFIISFMLMLSFVAGGWQSADAVTETGTCTHPDIKVVQAEPATCQKTGMKKHWKCESCGQLFKDAKGKKKATEKALTVKRKKHSFKEKKTDEEHLKTAATCTKPAVYYYSCRMCHEKGKKTFKSGKKLGHKFENSVTKATPSKDGSIGQKCTVCGKKGKGKKIYKASRIALPKKLKKGVPYVGNNREKPAVEVKNSKKKKIAASEYEITYQNTYDPEKGTGSGKATVTFKGNNYEGSKVIEYKIIGVPADAGKEEPEDKPQDQPEDKPQDQPEDKPQDQPADKPQEQSEDKPQDQPADKPQDQPADQPAAEESKSHTPTPEFWEKYDAEGMAGLGSYDAGSGELYAQYAEAYPAYDGPENNFDFFSVDFYTGSQPDYTYWSLVNWGMDCGEYMKRNGYTESDSVGAYAGLQDVGDHTTKIMSIWETYFTKKDGTKDTLVPVCLYPEGDSTSFDNEGSGTSLVAPFEWKANTWYRYVLRTWEHEDTTYAGTWVEDLSTGNVTLLAVYDTLLPKSSISGVPYQFLENYSDETHGEYRQMKLKNFCLRTSDSGKWIFPGTASLSIWASLEHESIGTYRFTADGDTIMLETCGLGENACKGMKDEDTIYKVKFTPAASAPDVSKYKIPEL